MKKTMYFICCLLFASLICAILIGCKLSFMTSAFFAVLITVMLWAVLKVLKNKANSFFSECENCKRIFALKKIKTELVRREDISILVELKQMHAKGGVVAETHPHYVPGERLFYEHHYECRYCGRRTVKLVTKDVKKE